MRKRLAIFGIVVNASVAVIAAAIGWSDLGAASFAMLAATVGMLLAKIEGFFSAQATATDLVLRILAGGAYTVALFTFGGLVVEGLLK